MSTPQNESCSRANQTLVEGIDYYIENGRWVFTAEYHRKRGYCCKNVCRHCPYGNSPADHANGAQDGETDRNRPQF